MTSLSGISVGVTGISSALPGVETQGIQANQYNIGVSGGGQPGELVPAIALSLVSASASGIADTLTPSVT